MEVIKMKKKILWFTLTPLAIILVLLLGVIGYIESHGLFFSSGQYLKCGESHMILMESGGATVLSYDDEEIFDGISNGDRIKILNDAILESYPSQTNVYYLKKLSDGTEADLPAGTLNSLREMGWIPKLTHTHNTADGNNVVPHKEGGYCGNTTTVLKTHIGTENEKEYSFWGVESVALTDLLLHLDYSTDNICGCEAEYFVKTEFGKSFYINLSESFATCIETDGNLALGQVALSDEQVKTISEIIKKAEDGKLDTISFYH